MLSQRPVAKRPTQQHRLELRRSPKLNVPSRILLILTKLAEPKLVDRIVLQATPVERMLLELRGSLSSKLYRFRFMNETLCIIKWMHAIGFTDTARRSPLSPWMSSFAAKKYI